MGPEELAQRRRRVGWRAANAAVFLVSSLLMSLLVPLCIWAWAFDGAWDELPPCLLMAFILCGPVVGARWAWRRRQEEDAEVPDGVIVVNVRVETLFSKTVDLAGCVFAASLPAIALAIIDGLLSRALPWWPDQLLVLLLMFFPALYALYAVGLAVAWCAMGLRLAWLRHHR